MKEQNLFKFQGSWQSPVPNDVIRCRELSDGARFLWILLRSYARPESPSPFPAMSTLCHFTGRNKDTVLRRIKELQNARYLIKKQMHGPNGEFRSNIYRLFDQPFIENPDTVKPVTVKPDTENPVTNQKEFSVKKNYKTNTTTSGAGSGSGGDEAAATPQENSLDKKVARSFLHHLSKAHQGFFKLSPPWTGKGRERVYAFFQENPGISNIAILRVVVNAWQIFHGKTGEPLDSRHYYCKQLMNVNDIFKVHPTHGQIMVIGAALELDIDVGNADLEECELDLQESGVL